MNDDEPGPTATLVIVAVWPGYSVTVVTPAQMDGRCNKRGTAGGGEDGRGTGTRKTMGRGTEGNRVIRVQLCRGGRWRCTLKAQLEQHCVLGRAGGQLLC